MVSPNSVGRMDDFLMTNAKEPLLSFHLVPFASAASLFSAASSFNPDLHSVSYFATKMSRILLIVLSNFLYRKKLYYQTDGTALL